ncbi:DUF3466 domain-containing protein [Vibrio tubiashii]|uniref:GlyGly-CTERM sorting domain-containing protein n=1 Tax=Vibrio tubiashii ATCC 19109 TaxID=1051646 RepID=F9T1Q8_9VIBR|nr:DUF3466 family protein [Vibrio tubiashii]AIW14036.1 hypothetical protein IX91_07450 [Vibrio tubiashii ATCC 19109]EGU58119.1 hypothetical protein VITU9109_03465 [Vibrio tubiashii ATCC 19109]EIF03182.1 hypothetical protein VT1337_14964 [Vibrio tubiashii NCIMB 1337 = ATCC 19106]
MTSKIFKISAVAATVAASFAANAALYNVYPEHPEGANTSILTYGVAISPETVKSGTNTCWDEACSESTSAMATEVKRYREGFNYRDEAPFFLPFGWNYLDDDWDGFRNYCRNYLGYADTLCENWANAQYNNGYKNEWVDKNFAGSIAYLNGSVVKADVNTVVTDIYNDGGTLKPVGSSQDTNITAYRSFKGFVASDSVTETGAADFNSALYWARKELATAAGTKIFTVGSITRNNINTDNRRIYTSKPSVWLGTSPAVLTEIPWPNSDRKENGDNRSQGSARDIIVDSNDNSILYAVGYTSDGDVRLKAAVFKSKDSGSTWEAFGSGGSNLVTGFPFDSEKYANQTLQAVNNNKIAIGTTKLNERQSGAYANSLFYVTNLDAPAYTAFSGSIFFTGANGKAGAINNHNDVVGTIDFESHPESSGSGGKPRAQRGFITNLGAAPATVPGSAAPIGGQARYLDDLTYGSGASTDNNQFRIVEASDINDAGVIAATAYFCSGGFESEAIDAKCTAGASLVGVKLVPISSSDRSITPRPVTQTTVERQGGSLGILVLTVLGLLGFRRK